MHLADYATRFTIPGPAEKAIVSQQTDGWQVFHPKAGSAGHRTFTDRDDALALACELTGIHITH